MLAITDLSGLDDFAHEYCHRHTGIAYYSHRLIGFCLLIKKKVWDEVGSFDEQFWTGIFKGDDLWLRVSEAGYMSMIAKDSFVHHVVSATFRTLDINYYQLLEQNRKKATEKLGNKINFLLNKPQISISLCVVVNNDGETITDYRYYVGLDKLSIWQ
jgi:GT2 family glycosyltransferase